MGKLQTLEELRTKQEVKDYFKQLGKKITEEELNGLKQSYDKTQESNNALTLAQLDDVAGGWVCIAEGKKIEVFENKKFTFFYPHCKPGEVPQLGMYIPDPIDITYINNYTLLKIEPDGKISSINNTLTTHSDYHTLDRLINFHGLEQIYISESAPNFKTQHSKVYTGGKFVLVPPSMIYENPNLPGYLSSICGDLSDGYHIDLNATFLYNPEELSPEENDNDSKS